MLKKNLIANYIGQGWTALMALAFVPLYIHYLGIEAYGLIGLFAVLSACLSLLDMGMAPTLGREMARFTGGLRSAQSLRDLLRSVELVAVAIAALVTVGVALAADGVASNWLDAESLPVEVIAQTFMIMGFLTALRVVEGVYRSSLIGLQRQVVFNAAISLLATVRGVGAVAVLAWLSPTIQAFFLFQCALSIFSVGVLAALTYRALPDAEQPAAFSLDALRGIWRFAGGMLGINLLAMLLTQSDKILLSKLLPLSDYGYYTLAALVAGVLFTIIAPITQAAYPRLCELQNQSDQGALLETFHLSAQLVSVIAGSFAIIVMLFAQPLLELWTQDEGLAQRTAGILSLLVLGNLLNGLMWLPYQTQLAHGWTSLTVKMNSIAVAVIVPALFWITPRYGAEGAAWAWVALNCGYLFVGVHFMYRRILVREKQQWYLQDVFKPLAACLLPALLLKVVLPDVETLVLELLSLLLVIIVVPAGALMGATNLRRSLGRNATSVWGVLTARQAS